MKEKMRTRNLPSSSPLSNVKSLIEEANVKPEGILQKKGKKGLIGTEQRELKETSTGQLR